MGITIATPQIDQRLVDEATQKEQRHAAIITIDPDVTTGSSGPTDTQKAAAKTKADQALADLKAGKAFEDVAKSVSKDAYATDGGDVGWIQVDDASLDPAFVKAVFAVGQAGGLTDVVSGAADSYIIGKVLDIAPQAVDAAWTQKIYDAGISMDAYRDAVRADLVRDALTTKVVADATGQPSVQRQVSEILVSLGELPGPG